jgi:hypothetical protein
MEAPSPPPFILDRNNASLMDGKAGMQSGKLKKRPTSILRKPGRQAVKYNSKEKHICMKTTCSLKQKL